MAAGGQLSMSRFERLFTRRKVSPTSQSLQTKFSEPRVLPDDGDSSPVFPSPSFIKPTASRMVARDDTPIKSPVLPQLTYLNLQKPDSIHVVSPTYKSSRYSQSSSSYRSSNTSSYISTSPSTVFSAEYTTESLNSSISRRREHLNVPRLNIQISSPPRSPEAETSSHLFPPSPFSPDFAPRPSFASCCSELSLNSAFDGGKLENFPHPPGPVTPPPSEASEIKTPKQASPTRNFIAPRRLVNRGPAPDFSAFAFPKTDPLPSLPTPSQSPKMEPRRALPPLPIGARPPRMNTRAVSNSEALRIRQTGLRRACSASGAQVALAKTAEPARPKTSQSVDGVLSEPTLVDFMHLADDDIAEEEVQPLSTLISAPIIRPRACTSVSAASYTPQSIAEPQSPYLTMSPPSMASQPAHLAAVRAAHIARRYDFSFVYVVNLWPNSAEPNADALPANGMTGRLLAAHGLESVQSPFRISSMVHSKILQSDDWVEYRCPPVVPNPGEFSQGYACSFYTGQYGRRKSEGDAKSSPRDSTRKNIDRGIVFAAYRKPSKDRVLRAYTPEELGRLREDAEGLVELLLDNHLMSSIKNQMRFSQQMAETGP